MRRRTFGSTGRRGTVIAASAAVLGLGGTVAACGGGPGDEGYVAVGAVGAGPAGTPNAGGLPSDKVTLIPLDTPGAQSDGTGEPGPGPGGPAPARPAALQVGDPVHGDADRRWCEKVTVEFRNSGGSPVRSRTVTFETHVIGALGVDWATVESTQPLPTPIDAGAVRKKTYTVCVDSWRVPLGMRTETQDVTADWK